MDFHSGPQDSTGTPINPQAESLGLKFHPYTLKLQQLLQQYDHNTTYELTNRGTSGILAVQIIAKKLPILIEEG